MADSTSSVIRVIGARQNNLDNLNVDFAIGTFTVITGPSGSGKSSLAFDTLYAEGQRRYVETFSPYARQFLDRCDRPKVDRIEGIPPAIAISQKNSVRTSRSTVGTMTEINDCLKLLFAREGHLFCGQCGREVRDWSIPDIWQDISQRAKQSGDPRLIITFGVLVAKGYPVEEALKTLNAQGFTRIQEQTHDDQGTTLQVVVDRFRASRVETSRAIEAIEHALNAGKGHWADKMRVYADNETSFSVWPYARGRRCAWCDIAYAEPSPLRFSFNSPVGACDTCHGFGRVIGIDLGLIIPDENKSLAEGCVKPWQTAANKECQADLLSFAKKAQIPVNTPWKNLTAKQKEWVIEGDPHWSGDWHHQWYGIRHFFAWLETKAYKMHVRVMLSRYRSYTLCPACHGARLKPESLLWRVGSRKAADTALAGSESHGPYRRFFAPGMPGLQAREKELPGLTLHDLMLLPVQRLLGFMLDIQRECHDEPGQLVLREIITKLQYLMDAGLGYLTLDRQSRTLSGGEVQRVNLTAALGTNLVDTLFVLDEPSVGLHPRDMDRIDSMLSKLCRAGNTLVVVEHDPQVMLAADRIVDMGPGSGDKGGRIVYNGPAKDITKSNSLTGLYLQGKLSVQAGLSRVPKNSMRHWLEMIGATEHNLKNIDVRIPLQTLTVITGVSGSGKSSLITDTLVPALQRHFGEAVNTGALRNLRGVQYLDGVRFVDQSAIGKTSRSNPVSYVGAFDKFRELFAATPRAQERGYTAGTFSFNSGNGRCPTCLGAGFERVEMQFLSDVYLRCPDCNGKRYRSEVLEVTIALQDGREVNISDVLDMTVDEAVTVFSQHRDIVNRLHPLQDVGLGYVKLGQPVSTLSGGECQRVKLAGILSEHAVSSAKAKKELFVFDEPTTGLHFDDISKLLRALRRLVAQGNSVIVVEHNLDVMDAADWIIDLGPEGGDEGGRIVAAGTPDELVKEQVGYTARALRAYRRTFTEPGYTMQGLFADAAPQTRPSEHGRSLQSVWRQARPGDLGIFGAREHNLKNIDVIVPKNRLSVITGVSGSGKSTLAFGIIFSEGQRRYLESLNAYARSIVQPSARADVDRIVGIAPTVAIEQRTSRGGRKSTVATLTEIQQYLRLLYVKLGVQYCPHCHVPVVPQSFDAIAASLVKEMRGQRLTITAPIVTARKGIYVEQAKNAAKRGIALLHVDGQWVPTESFPKLSRYQEHTIDSPSITLTVSAQTEPMLREGLKQALFEGHGVITVFWGNQALGGETEKKGGYKTYSTKRACPICRTSFSDLDPRLFSYNSKIGWCPQCFGTGEIIEGFSEDQTGEESVWKESGAQSCICPACHGMRLNPVARNVFFAGRSICETTALSVHDCLAALKAIALRGREKAIGEDAIKEIRTRLEFLEKVGLGYLTLDRAAPSLSGGEAQRIRLAAQLGSNLQGACYILDEPTIGLHARDNTRLIDSLENLRRKGNTVIVVEHDEEMIRRAEHIIDIGPGAGSQGGELVIEGNQEDVKACTRSVTGLMLAHPAFYSGKAQKPVTSADEYITVRNAKLHNLNNLTVSFPLGHLIALTGVSGSGKSTLARDVLLASLSQSLEQQKSGQPVCVGCDGLEGLQYIDRVLEVDQTPIGKTSRSCPATYIGFFNQIRDLFAATLQAKEMGYGASRFSFNTPEGRCPVCAGQGQITVEMNFLPDVKVLCEACHGMRFDEATLSVLWQGKSIGEILQMPVDDALTFFASSPRIAAPLQLLHDVGLGYLTLGQPSSTLSGGEAQRIKLVTELSKASQTDLHRSRRMPKTFYVLDEPTVGLHMADVSRLTSVLERLVKAGNTVLVIEHNLDVIACADWIIDLGPEGGPQGGSIVAQGEPIDLSKRKTPTGAALKTFLREHKKQG